MTRRTILKLTGASVAAAVLAALFEFRGEHAIADGTSETSTGPVSVKVFNDKGELVGPITMPKIVKSDADWKKQLTTDEYNIARDKGTEPAFCGNLLDNHKEGVYSCICCGLPLFSSHSKFNSGTGWPSFFQPVAEENVTKHQDDSLGMERTEILCMRCDCHLGHVFDDGPKPMGLRFCVNSASLKFTDADKLATLADPAANQANPANDRAIENRTGQNLVRQNLARGPGSFHRVFDPTTIHVVAVIFLATLIRSSFGFGEALVAVPLLALRLPVAIAAPLAVMVSVTVAFVIVVQDWRKIQVRSRRRAGAGILARHSAGPAAAQVR